MYKDSLSLLKSTLNVFSVHTHTFPYVDWFCVVQHMCIQFHLHLLRLSFLISAVLSFSRWLVKLLIERNERCNIRCIVLNVNIWKLRLHLLHTRCRLQIKFERTTCLFQFKLEIAGYSHFTIAFNVASGVHFLHRDAIARNDNKVVFSDKFSSAWR